MQPSSLRTIGLSVKILYTSILVTMGTGYFFAVTYLFLVDVQPHVERGHSVSQAVMEKYHGRREMTALEASLVGSMGDEVTPLEKTELLSWVRAGAREEDFDAVASIFENSCAVCHNHDDLPDMPLTTFAEIATFTKQDEGVPAKRLVRQSHIHVFGLTFIFAIVGGIFVQSESKSVWRGVLVAVPFLAVWADIGGWWFTKLNPSFAWTVLLGGGLAGLSLGVQIILSLAEMWLLRPTKPGPESAAGG